ncbi:hypothetical protein ACJX0J_010484 [Zea mays]
MDFFRKIIAFFDGLMNKTHIIVTISCGLKMTRETGGALGFEHHFVRTSSARKSDPNKILNMFLNDMAVLLPNNISKIKNLGSYAHYIGDNFNTNVGLGDVSKRTTFVTKRDKNKWLSLL